MDTNTLLDLALARQGLPSDYALAARLGITRAAVSGYRHGRSCPTDATAESLAELAGLDPDAVVLAMHVERARSADERSRWQRIAARLAAGTPAALAAVILSGLAAVAPDAAAAVGARSGPANGGGSVYYVNPLAQLRASLRRLRSMRRPRLIRFEDVAPAPACR